MAAAPADVVGAVRAAIAPDGVTMLLSRVPKAHTTGELTSLLEGSADPLAAEFLAARSEKDKAKQKELLVQMAPGGKFAPLLSSLAQKVDSPPPFAYAGFPMAQGGSAAEQVAYLRSIEFLHFPLEAPESASRIGLCAGINGCIAM